MDEVRPGDARFDPERQAWILTSYADVSAALREPLLAVAGADSESHGVNLSVREAGGQVFPLPRLSAWRSDFERGAVRMATSLPAGQPVDLVRDFAAPCSLALAVAVTGAAPADAEPLAGLARNVFLAAACATAGEPAPQAQAAVAELARRLPAMGGSLTVQSFVALSQTLPCFLASAWLELLQHPSEASALRSDPALLPRAIEELLRHASPSRAIFRRALAPVTIGRASMNPRDHVILMLSAANHDAAQFPAPSRLDFGRDAAGHLAFGRGPHACFGAQLIRMAAAVLTEALLGASTSLELAGEVEWTGGFAIYAPATLPVVLRRSA